MQSHINHFRRIYWYMRSNIFLILFLAAGLTACQKDLDIFIPDINQAATDSSWTNTPPTELPVQSDIWLPSQKDTIRFLGTGPFSFTTRSGLLLQMRLGQWVDSSNVPTNISPYFVESHWITRKGDMIRTQLDLTGSNTVIQTNGIAFLQLRNSTGSLLQVAQGSLFNYSVSAAVSQSNFFIRSNSIWVPPADNLNRVTYNGQLQRLEFQTKLTGWMAAGNSLTWQSNNPIQINTPTGFGNSNTLVYLMNDTQNWVRRANANHLLRRFEFSGLPGVNDVRIVGISKQGGQYYWANVNTNANSSAPISISLTFNPISLAELLQQLNSL